MNQNSSPVTGRTALIVGGGGSAGNAWSIGVIAGLASAGIDVTSAGLIVGTSAGSTTAAQITCASVESLYAATVQMPTRLAGAGGADRPARPVRDQNSRHTDRLGALVAASRDMPDLRRRLGAAALEQADVEMSARWRATVASRLPRNEWPAQRLLITAVDARTGDPVMFDRDSGVELVDAVAASCSSGPAYPIGDGWYIDGGFRANAENADLAAGYACVLVLAPFGGRSLRPPTWGTDLATHVDELRAGGSEVVTVFPEGDVAAFFAPGGNVMSPAARIPAAQAGYEQGRRLAPSLAALWA